MRPATSTAATIEVLDIAVLLVECPSSTEENPTRSSWDLRVDRPVTLPSGNKNARAADPSASATFEEARADFGIARQVFLSKRTELIFRTRTARLDRKEISAVGFWQAARAVQLWERASLSTASADANAARYSTCAATSRCWCTCPTSRQPKLCKGTLRVNQTGERARPSQQ